MMYVEKLSVWSLIAYFIIYLAIHIVIGWSQKQTEGKLIFKHGASSKNRKELEERLKMLTFMFRWFPAFYLILIVLILSFYG